MKHTKKRLWAKIKSWFICTTNKKHHKFDYPTFDPNIGYVGEITETGAETRFTMYEFTK